MKPIPCSCPLVTTKAGRQFPHRFDPRTCIDADAPDEPDTDLLAEITADNRERAGYVNALNRVVAK